MNPVIVNPTAVLAGAGRSPAQARLARALMRADQPGGAPEAKVRLGVVSAFDTATWTLTCTISGYTGDVTGVPSMTGHAVAVGETVLLLQFGSSYVAVGQLGLPRDPYLNDSGWLSSGLSAQSGFSASGTVYRKVGGKWVEARIDFTRTGADLNFTSNDGDIAVQDILQMPAGYRPSSGGGTVYATGVWNSAMAFFRMTSSGMVTCTALVPDRRDGTTYTKASGSTGVVNFFYMV